MKPFDLERAKAGDPIVTRNGREAKFIAHVPELSRELRLLFLIDGDIKYFHESGEFYKSRMHELDLFMAPKKRIVWVNFYENHQCVYFNLQSEANTMSQGIKRLGGKAYPVEIEE